MKRLLTMTEAARALRVNRSTIWRWIKAGKLPATKPGRDWRISRAAVDRLLEDIPED